MNDNINGLNEILINSNAYDVEEEFIAAVEQSIRMLYYSDKPLSVNGMRVPSHQVREDLKRLRWKHIDLAIRNFKIASEVEQIRNPLGYFGKCIYNSIFDSEIKLNSELRYNGHI